MDSEERPSKFQKLSHDFAKNIPSEKAGSLENSLPSSKGLELTNSGGAPLDKSTNHFDDSKSGVIGSTENDHESHRLPVDDHNIHDTETKQLSKNQQKKLSKKQLWEEGRDARKAKRKKKFIEKRERKRAVKAAQTSNPDSSLPQSIVKAQNHDRNQEPKVQLPVTIIIDCSFDDLMNENERISLGGQITRSYSDNKNSRLRAHLAISSWGGFLKERFDNLLRKQYESWKYVRWVEGDFVEASKQAKEWMVSQGNQKLEGALLKRSGEETDIETLKDQAEIVYLSSESDNTLSELKPYSTYIIGGLVDKNRHKGVCYKRAMDRGIKTAQLPIGEFMNMNSRKVLATNHVSEIMLKWLESGDWGEAFLQVMPKRKGGQLKERGTTKETQKEDEGGGDEDSFQSASHVGNASPTGGSDDTDEHCSEEIEAGE